MRSPEVGLSIFCAKKSLQKGNFIASDENVYVASLGRYFTRPLELSLPPEEVYHKNNDQP